MSWQQWVLVAFFALAAFVNVCTIGKARKPLTPQVAAISLAIQVGLIALVVTA